MLTRIANFWSRAVLAALVLAASLHFALAQEAPAVTTPPASVAAPLHVSSAPQSGLSFAFAAPAAQVASALNEVHAKQVAVFDFLNPQSTRWDRVGQRLAAEFRASLDATKHKFVQASEPQMLKWMRADAFEQRDLFVADVAGYMIRQTKVDGIVLTYIVPSDDGKTAALSFNVYGVRDGAEPTTYTTTISLTSDLAALVDPKPADPPDPDGPLSAPVCIDCPPADYTGNAADNRFSGTVFLNVVIEPNGRAGKISVTKGVPYGLNGAAISAVRKWRLKPAYDSKHRAFAVSQRIEVEFRMGPR